MSTPDLSGGTRCPFCVGHLRSLNRLRRQRNEAEAQVRQLTTKLNVMRAHLKEAREQRNELAERKQAQREEDEK